MLAVPVQSRMRDLISKNSIGKCSLTSILDERVQGVTALLEAYACGPCDDGCSHFVPVVVIVSWRVYSKVIRRVVENAPELKFAPEHAETVRLGCQSQVSLTRIDLYAKFAEIKVVSVTKKALRDLTEEDAKVHCSFPTS